MKNTEILDSESRNKIVNILNKNFFVVANAGSGKTSILVNRMVAMVESGIDISKICAITFTKNAATEFLDRFQEALRKREKAPDIISNIRAGDLGGSSDIKRNRCSLALKNINQCFLGTIDSFCNQVLSEYPLDAGIPSSSGVIDDKEEIKMYLNEYTLISREKDSSIYESFLAFNTLNKNGEDVFSKSIGDIIGASSLNVSFSEPKISLYEAFKIIKEKYEADIKHDIDELLKCESVENSGNNTYKDNFEAFIRASNNLKDSWNINNFIEIIESISNSVKNLRLKDEPLTNIIIFSFMPRGKAYKYESDGNPLSNLLNEINNLKYQYSISFLLKVSTRVRKRLKSLGKLTFDEYLLTFRNMLINDMESDMKIIEHIRNKHSYFLIDESQDTSPFQTELFLYLTSKVKATRIEDCKPIAGSLFILGDPKQSIYRFRGADVPSYLKTKDLFDKVFDRSENEVLVMTRNFRSTSLIIDYFNDVFKNMDNYEEIPESKGIGGTSGLYTYNDYVDVIKEMLGNNKYKVNTKDGERAPLFKDFMIITKSKSGHDEIIKRLKDNNIPCYVEGSFSISNSDIVKSVYAVFNYIVNKDNLISSGALYDLLVSPLFKIKSDEIIGIDLNKLPKEIKEFLDKIDYLCDIDDPLILFDEILNNIEIFKMVEYSNMEYVYYINEALKNAYYESSISSLNDALAFVEDFIGTMQERVMSMDFKPNAVRLANLHKVKGLEAPIVILIKAGKSSANPAIRNDFINNKSYIMQTAKDKYANGNTYYKIKTDMYSSELELEKQEKEKEDERLKYVAATRTRSYLFIDDSSRTNYWASLLNDDFTKFSINGIREIIQDEIDINSSIIDINVNFDNKETYQILSPSKLDLDKVKSKYSDSDLDNYNLDARLKGTIIHRMMELIVNSKFSLSNDDIVNILSSEYNLDNEEYVNLVESIYDRMHNGGYKQNNGAEADLFKILRESLCYCEVPFSYKDNGDIWYGNIDLLYLYNGNWYILDYKTNYESDNLDKEYANQLNAYKKALKEIKGIEAQAFIYHIG